MFEFDKYSQHFQQIAEILKDRPSWFRECRSLEVFTMFPAGNGGTIELVYTQVNTNGCNFKFLLLSTNESSCPKEELQIASDICSNYTGSCTGFLDSEIHYKLRQWQSCGKHAFYCQIQYNVGQYFSTSNRQQLNLYL